MLRKHVAPLACIPYICTCEFICMYISRYTESLSYIFIYILLSEASSANHVFLYNDSCCFLNDSSILQYRHFWLWSISDIQEFADHCVLYDYRCSLKWFGHYWLQELLFSLCSAILECRCRFVRNDAWIKMALFLHSSGCQQCIYHCVCYDSHGLHNVSSVIECTYLFCELFWYS